jgi:predicted XRE-type DNA-binding protein
MPPGDVSRNFQDVEDDAVADTPGQAANLRARAELMRQIAALVKQHGRTQVDVAERFGVAQPRINDLLRGRVS